MKAVHAVGAMLAGGVVVPVLLVVMFGAAVQAQQGPGLPATLLDAYTRAASSAGTLAPGCTDMKFSILAAIGQVESTNASDHDISETGDITPPIIGPRLDGSGAGGNLTPIYDTDQGALDAGREYDRAIGLLQFLPATWATVGRDGNGDGETNPHNAYDAAAAAVVLLCGTGPRALDDPDQLTAALLAYNNSATWVAEVMGWIAAYDQMAATAVPGAVTGGAAQMIAAAQAWLGWPYAWGGGGGTVGLPICAPHEVGSPGCNGPSRGICCSPGGHDGSITVGFDCSGLTEFAAAAVGVDIPGTSATQFYVGTRIPRGAGLAALQPGDLVFFGYNPIAGTGIHHVAIYVGDGMMLEAPHTGAVVRYAPMRLSDYAGGSRIL